MKESPQGMQPPAQNVVKKPQHQPSRLRKFVAKNSAGLRIRAHPSLQSEQIGIVLVNDTIAFIDEVRAISKSIQSRTFDYYCRKIIKPFVTPSFSLDSQRRRRLAATERGNDQGVLQQQPSGSLVFAVQPTFGENVASPRGGT